MDVKLKEAIAAVRAGDRTSAQEQLTTLLAEKPEEVQGWYLLSLLVDSPQKQAAYLSKTLALDPNHAKAKEQLTTLQGAGAMAATSTFEMDVAEPMDLWDQSESTSLPDWLEAEPASLPIPEPAEAEEEETAVPNDTLPDWLQEPAMVPSTPETTQEPTKPEHKMVEDLPTLVGQRAESDDDVDKAVSNLRQQTIQKTQAKPPANKKQPKAKAKKAANKGSTGINLILGVLVVLALLVMVALAYLIFA